MPQQMLSEGRGTQGASCMFVAVFFFFFNEMGRKGYCLFLITFCMFEL